MMYICERCGELYDEDEAFRTSYIYDGAHKLARCDDICRCEHCGGELAEAVQCEVCGAYVPNTGARICDCCIEDAENVETALKFGDTDTVSIEINGFAASALGVEWIQAMLRELIRQKATEKDIKNYIKSDLYNLTEFLSEEAAIKANERSVAV